MFIPWIVEIAFFPIFHKQKKKKEMLRIPCRHLLSDPSILCGRSITPHICCIVYGNNGDQIQISRSQPEMTPYQ